MALLTAFVTYLAKFIAMLMIVAAGFILGKKVREIKNKNENDAKNPQSVN